jgi:hypothetical protein
MIIKTIRNRLKKSKKLRKVNSFLHEVKKVYKLFYKQKDNYSSYIHRGFERAYSNKKFSMVSVIDAPLKWSYDSYDFRSIYSGSSDRILFEGLLTSNRLKKFTKQNDCILISVIGGGYFLDITTRFDFSEIILFDSNINEHAKISAYLNRMDKGTFNTKEIEIEITNDIRSLVPFINGAELTFQTTNNCLIEYNYPEIEGSFAEPILERGFPIVELEENFPLRSINISDDEKLTLTSKLRERLDKRIYKSIPNIDANGRVVVIFLSNIDEYYLPNYEVHRKITNSPATIILRGDNEIAERNLEDSHLNWKLAVYKELIGFDVLHLVSNKRYINGSNLDFLINGSTLLSRSNLDIENANALFLHIMLGHSKSKLYMSYLMKRKLKKLPKRINKIVVTEHSINYLYKGVFLRRWISDEFIIRFYNDLFDAFELTGQNYIYGNGDKNRNIMLLYRR